jgi:hypothetical protein
MNGELTQDNLYLLLPGKVLAVAQMYARNHNVTLLDALHKVYASDMYKELEQESYRGNYFQFHPLALNLLCFNDLTSFFNFTPTSPIFFMLFCPIYSWL